MNFSMDVITNRPGHVVPHCKGLQKCTPYKSFELISLDTQQTKVLPSHRCPPIVFANQATTRLGQTNTLIKNHFETLKEILYQIGLDYFMSSPFSLDLDSPGLTRTLGILPRFGLVR